MNINSLVHLYAPNLGGVEDYVNEYIKCDPVSNKIGLKKNLSIGENLPKTCLLHYSGYGFSSRGTPMWLLNKIQTERKHIKTLGVFFHELYAFGPPWVSAFWLSPMQRYIARRLVEMSDFWITNREGSAQWLCRFSGDKPHAVLPVFSNVGEMAAYIAHRVPKIVVFGSASLRAETYKAAGKSLFSWAHNQGLELHDIGSPINDSSISSSLRDAGVIQHGRLNVVDVSKKLSDAKFGILAYPADCLSKSGVFASFCAHGICPIIISKNYGFSDGLIVNKNYLSFESKEKIKDTNSVAFEAFSWYQLHCVEQHTRIIKEIMHG